MAAILSDRDALENNTYIARQIRLIERATAQGNLHDAEHFARSAARNASASDVRDTFANIARRLVQLQQRPCPDPTPHMSNDDFAYPPTSDGEAIVVTGRGPTFAEARQELIRQYAPAKTHTVVHIDGTRTTRIIPVTEAPAQKAA